MDTVYVPIKPSFTLMLRNEKLARRNGLGIICYLGTSIGSVFLGQAWLDTLGLEYFAINGKNSPNQITMILLTGI
jgi:hypothetical protein